MGIEFWFERREFQRQINEWLQRNPENVKSLLEEMSQISSVSVMSVTQEAQLAARLARRLWAQAGLEPPRPR